MGTPTDGHFHYTGEGQRGDQQLKSGNAAILWHRGEGRALRVFQGARGTVEYMGELDEDQAGGEFVFKREGLSWKLVEMRIPE